MEVHNEIQEKNKCSMIENIHLKHMIDLGSKAKFMNLTIPILLPSPS